MNNQRRRLIVGRLCRTCGRFMPHAGRDGYCDGCWPTSREAARGKLYADPRWAQARAVVMARDNYRCQVCGRGHGDVVLSVDHIGGDYSDPFNADTLRTICRSCHGTADAPRAGRRP